LEKKKYFNFNSNLNKSKLVYDENEDFADFSFLNFLQVEKIENKIEEKSKSLHVNSFDHFNFPVDYIYNNQNEKRKNYMKKYLPPESSENKFLNNRNYAKNNTHGLTNGKVDTNKTNSSYKNNNLLKQKHEENLINEIPINLKLENNAENNGINNKSILKELKAMEKFDSNLANNQQNSESAGILYLGPYEKRVYGFEENSKDFISNNRKTLSVPNAFSLAFSLMVSSVICIIIAVYESQECLIDSILKRNGGNAILTFFFWKTVHRFRDRERDRFINNGNTESNPNHVNYLNSLDSNNNGNENDNNLRNSVARNYLNAENDQFFRVDVDCNNFNQNEILYVENPCENNESVNNQIHKNPYDTLIMNNCNLMNLSDNELINNKNFKNDLNKINQISNAQDVKLVRKSKTPLVKHSNSDIKSEKTENIFPISNIDKSRNSSLQPIIISDQKLNDFYNSSENISLNNSNSMNNSLCRHYSLVKFNDLHRENVKESKFSSNENIFNLNGNITNFNGNSYFKRVILSSKRISNLGNSIKKYEDKLSNFYSDNEEVCFRSRSVSSSKTIDCNMNNVL
jgi:hypothetical protein